MDYTNIAYSPLEINDKQRIVSKKKIIYITGKRYIGKKTYNYNKMFKYI
jgi:hypothetical protein